MFEPIRLVTWGSVLIRALDSVQGLTHLSFATEVHLFAEGVVRVTSANFRQALVESRQRCTLLLNFLPFDFFGENHLGNYSLDQSETGGSGSTAHIR